MPQNVCQKAPVVSKTSVEIAFWPFWDHLLIQFGVPWGPNDGRKVTDVVPSSSTTLHCASNYRAMSRPPGVAKRIRRTPEGGAGRVGPCPEWADSADSGGPRLCRRPFPKSFLPGPENRPNFRPQKKSLFGSKWVPFWRPLGSQNPQNLSKMPPQSAPWTPSKKCVKKGRFFDLPNP